MPMAKHHGHMPTCTFPSVQMLHFRRRQHQLHCKCCREISLLLPRRLGRSWTSTRGGAPVPTALAYTNLGLLPGTGHQPWTATRHRAPAPTTRVLAKAPLWRDLRAYHGSTISSTIHKSRAQKIAQEIAQLRAQFTNHEHKKSHKK